MDMGNVTKNTRETKIIVTCIKTKIKTKAELESKGSSSLKLTIFCLCF